MMGWEFRKCTNLLVYRGLSPLAELQHNGWWTVAGIEKRIRHQTFFL
jgi:hypothetical protein